MGAADLLAVNSPTTLGVDASALREGECDRRADIIGTIICRSGGARFNALKQHLARRVLSEAWRGSF